MEEELNVKLTVFIPKGLHRRVKVFAAEIDQGMRDVVIRALEEHLALHGRAHAAAAAKRKGPKK